jgi:hypothetical protein
MAKWPTTHPSPQQKAASAFYVERLSLRQKARYINRQAGLRTFPFLRNEEPPMPRFFFHLTHDGLSVDDSEGVVLPDRIAAWEGASSACREFIREFDDQLEAGTAFQVDVYDQDGPLFRFEAEALR